MSLPTGISTLLAGDIVESARVEFKESWDPQAPLKTICAFANDIDNWGGATSRPQKLEREALLCADSLPSTPMVGGFAGDEMRRGLSTREERILELLGETPSLSIAELATSLGVTTKTIQRDIAHLRGADLLGRIRAHRITKGRQVGCGVRHKI